MSRETTPPNTCDKNPSSIFSIPRSGHPIRLRGSSPISTTGTYAYLTDSKDSSKTHYGKDSRSLYSPIGEKFTDYAEDEKTVQQRRIRELERNINSLEISSLKSRKNEKADEDNWRYLESSIQGRDDVLEEILEKNKSLINEVERLKIVIKEVGENPHQSRGVGNDGKSRDTHSSNTEGTSYSSLRPSESYLNDLSSENENLKTKLKHLRDKNENSMKLLRDAKCEYGGSIKEQCCEHRSEIKDLKVKLQSVENEAVTRERIYANLNIEVKALRNENILYKEVFKDNEGEIRRLNETITTNREEIMDLKGKIMIIQDEADSRGTHHASLTTEVSTLRIENDRLKEMIEYSRKSNIMVNEQVAQLKSMRERDRHPEDRDLRGMSSISCHDGAGDASVKIELLRFQNQCESLNESLQIKAQELARAMKEIDSLKKECSQLKLENKRPQSNNDFHQFLSFGGQTTKELNDLRKECDRLKALLNVKAEEMTRNPHQSLDGVKDGISRDNNSSNTKGTIYLINRPNESNLNDLISANENLKNELKHLTDKNENSMKKLADAKNKFGDKEKESRQLNETITTYREEIRDLNGKLNVIQGEADSRGTHNASLTTEVSTLRIENDRLKELIEEAMSRRKYEKAADYDWHLLERHMEVWKSPDASSVVKENIRSSTLLHPNFTNKKRDDVLEEILEKNKSLTREVERLKIVIEKAGDLKTE